MITACVRCQRRPPVELERPAEPPRLCGACLIVETIERMPAGQRASVINQLTAWIAGRSGA